MQFLIDRGIDMTIMDYRWGATAAGWARYGKQTRRWRSGWRMRNGSGN